MKTATEALDFIDKHASNLLLTRDGHGGLQHILSVARQQAHAAATEKAVADAAAAASSGGPG